MLEWVALIGGVLACVAFFIMLVSDKRSVRILCIVYLIACIVTQIVCHVNGWQTYFESEPESEFSEEYLLGKSDGQIEGYEEGYYYGYEDGFKDGYFQCEEDNNIERVEGFIPKPTEPPTQSYFINRN